MWQIYHILFCSLTNKCTQLFHKLTHSYMFRHCRVILRELVVSTLPSYTSMSNAVVGLLLQSFDWLAAFHLDLLQATLFIAV